MAIGGVWKAGPAGPGARIVAGAGPVEAPTPVSIADPAPFLQYQWPKLAATRQTVANTPPGLQFPVATLPAPGDGLMYVIERITLFVPTDGSTSTAMLVVGALDSRNAVDEAANPYPGMTSADPQPIRVPAHQPLHIVFFGGSDPAECSASLQLRVEEMP